MYVELVHMDPTCETGIVMSAVLPTVTQNGLGEVVLLLVGRSVLVFLVYV
jgi:hypothetical protein